MKNKSDKWSIQISKNLYECLKTYCKDIYLISMITNFHQNSFFNKKFDI